MFRTGPFHLGNRNTSLNQCSFRLVFLDRATSTWKTAGGNPLDRPLHYLKAADGNDLVIVDRSQANPGVHLLWVQPDQFLTPPSN